MKLSHKLRSRFNKQLDEFAAKEGRSQRRPFIVPSKFGFYFGGGILVLLILAFTYANQLIYLIAFFFSSFLFIVMHLTNNNIKHLSIDGFQISSTFLDQIPKVLLTLGNEHNKFFVRFIEIQINGKSQKMVPELKPGEHLTISIPLPVTNRGLLAYPRITLSTTFPFGIFYSWKRVHWKNHFFVYPARQGELDFPQASQLSENDNQLLLAKANKASDGEFIMHKEYTPSDNFKRIDWRVFARKNKLFTKIYSEHQTRLIYIPVETLLNVQSLEAFEKSLSQITKWIFEAQKNHFICAIKFNDQPVILPETPREYDSLYEKLALLKYQGLADGQS